MLTRNLPHLSGVSTRSRSVAAPRGVLKAEKAGLRRKLHAAVVGAGPAGFYAADELFKSALANVKVDMYERLPVPYGLVRNGVAPDHPEVKAVESVFHTLALSPHFNFIGNVNVGKDLSIEELQKHYDIVILAYGADGDKKLGIPGEDLKGVYSARTFVEWYNAFSLQNTSKDAFDLSGSECVVIGNGNVAVDVARILLKEPSELASTDISEVALDALRDSKIRKVSLVGRRGPVQAAFTTAELRELISLGGGNPVATPAKKTAKDSGPSVPLSSPLEDSTSTIETVMMNPATIKKQTVIKSIPDRMFMGTEADEVELKERAAARKFDLLRKLLAIEPLTQEAFDGPEKPKTLQFYFLRSPTAFNEDPSRPGHVGSITFEHTLLKGEPGKQWASPMGFSSQMKADLVLSSIGYYATPMPGLPFDVKKGIIPNLKGKVSEHDGVYVCGWIKRGPSGIIGTNKYDAQEVIETIVSDLAGTEHIRKEPMEDNYTKTALPEIQQLLQERGVSVVSFDEWLKINELELQEGREKSKVREKLKTIPAMLNIAKKAL